MFAGQEYITMADAGLVTIFSMTTVFLSLLVISYVIDLIKMAFSPKDKKKSDSEPQVIYVKEPVDENELPVVMMAAIEQYERERLVNPIARSQEGTYKNWR